jgi:hypothetical protein
VRPPTVRCSCALTSPNSLLVGLTWDSLLVDLRPSGHPLGRTSHRQPRPIRTQPGRRARPGSGGARSASGGCSRYFVPATRAPSGGRSPRGRHQPGQPSAEKVTQIIRPPRRGDLGLCLGQAPRPPEVVRIHRPAADWLPDQQVRPALTVLVPQAAGRGGRRVPLVPRVEQRKHAAGAGVGGGSKDWTVETNRPGPITIPSGAAVAVLRYTADHDFTLGAVA